MTLGFLFFSFCLFAQNNLKNSSDTSSLSKQRIDTLSSLKEIDNNTSDSIIIAVYSNKKNSTVKYEKIAKSDLKKDTTYLIKPKSEIFTNKKKE